MRIALVGKIDINRDGKDDRGDLKRMIEGAGGQVVFDLPPPDVGRKSGDLTGRIDWFVDDERDPLIQNESRQSTLTGNEQEAFLKTRSDTIRELRATASGPSRSTGSCRSSAMTTPRRPGVAPRPSTEMP